MGYLLGKFGKEKLKRAYPDLNFDQDKLNADQLSNEYLGQTLDSDSEPQTPTASPDPLQSARIENTLKNDYTPPNSEDGLKDLEPPFDTRELVGTRDQLLNAQKERDDKLRGADLNEYLGLLGKTLGRQKENLVTPFAQRQREQAGLGIKKQEELIGNEVNDPQSDISKVARERLKKAMPELKDQAGFENLTAAQLEKMFGKPASDKGLQQSRYQDAEGNVRIGKWDAKLGLIKSEDDAIAGFSQDIRTDPYTGELLKTSKASGGIAQNKGIGPIKVEDPAKEGEKKEESPEDKEAREAFELRTKLNPKQRDIVEKQNEAMLKDTSKNRDAISASQSVRNLLNAPKDGKMDYDILRALQNQISRSTGEVGAMTEGDVAPFGGRATVLGKLQRWGKMATVGQIPDEDRKLLQNLSKVMEVSAQKGLQQQSRIYQQNVSASTGLKLDQAAKLLGVKAAAMENAPAEMVTVINKDGKKGSIPKKNLEKALKQGFSLAE